MGPRRSGRGRGGPARRRRRYRGARARARVRGSAAGLRPPPPGRSRRSADAHRTPGVRGPVDGGRSVRQRREGRPGRAVRRREGARAAARRHPRLRRQGPQARSLAHAPCRLALRVDRPRRVPSSDRRHVRLPDDVRTRRARQGQGDAHRLALGGRDGRGAPLLERQRGLARRPLPRPRLRSLRDRRRPARRLEPPDREGLRRRPCTRLVAAPGRRERSAGRQDRGRPGPDALDAPGRRRRAPRQGRRRARARTAGARAGVRAPGEGPRPRDARSLRALPGRDGVGRSDRAPRTPAGERGGRQGADRAALAPRGRARREP